MKRVAYISGPIAGHDELNEPLFRAAKRRLESERNTAAMKYDKAIVPHDVPEWHHEGECPGGYRSSPASPHSAACYLRTDLIVMLTQAEAVWMLPGWEASVGARLEMQVAAACGLSIHFFHRGDLGCLHTNHTEWRKCEESSCWNARKPLDQVHTRASARKIAAAACVHPLTQFGNEAFCKVEHCPNYYGRNAL